MTPFQEKLQTAAIFTYRLIDGSYVIAEEVDYDLDENILVIDKPLSIIDIDVGFRLKPWIITDLSESVYLRDDMIVASAAAPISLRHNYFQFVLLEELRKNLTDTEFEEIASLILPAVDSKDSDESDEFDFDKPFKVKKIKEEQNDKDPWDRY